LFKGFVYFIYLGGEGEYGTASKGLLLLSKLSLIGEDMPYGNGFPKLSQIAYTNNLSV
jgi:hypothetical protein